MIAFKKLFILFSFIIFGLILFSFSVYSIPQHYFTECREMVPLGICLAMTCPDGSVCPQCTCRGSWTEYKTNAGGVGPRILTRECRSVCGPAIFCCNCGPCRAQCDPWRVCENCGNWQIGTRITTGENVCQQGFCDATRAGLVRPECKACVNYVETPQNPRYYKNPLYPLNPWEPEESRNRENIFLPVKLDWDNIEGWIGGWRLPETKVIAENQGREKCEITLGAGRALANCKIGCKDECWKKMEKEWSWQIKPPPRTTKERAEKEVNQEMEYWNYLPKCIRECEKECVEKNRITTRPCPDVQCSSDEDYIKSYIIEIRGRERTRENMKDMMRDSEKLVEIEKLEREIEFIKKGFFPGTPNPDRIIRENETKIEEIEKELEINSFRAVLDRSEFIPPSPCFFKSDRNYQWRVRACIKRNGEACGPWGNWHEFNTKFVPELKTPLDPDWLGEKLGINQRLNVVLRWCDLVFRKETARRIIKTDPKSFKLFFYLGYREPNGRERTIFHPWLVNEFPLILSDPREQPLQPRFLNEERRYFTKSPFYHQRTKYNFYGWKAASCEGERGRKECTEFGQKWRFAIKENIELETSRLIRPPNNIDIPVGFPFLFEWDAVLGAKSYILEINRNGRNIFRRIIPGGHTYNVDHPTLSLNTIYQWRIRACSDFDGRICEPRWSSIRHFKTTGRSPQLEKPTGLNIIIPTIFEWEDVPGAKSYLFRILKNGSEIKSATTTESKITIEFPILHQETNYSWQVKTCARLKGELCGEWSPPQVFTTFRLQPPINLVPETNSTLHSGDLHNFSWDLNAKYHQFNFAYQRAEREEREKCVRLAEEGKTKILEQNSLFFPLECRGNYQWKVRGCLDKNCTEGINGSAGEWSEEQNIVLAARITPEERRRGVGGLITNAGLVPCGLRFDDPNTQWVETNRCELKHLFIVLYLILNFFLWTMIPLILVILVAISGAIFYFSLSVAEAEPLSKVKSLWKSAGIGLLIIFLAWNVVSFILSLLGYQVGIFGPWWEI
jgi:hypothetical protein